MRSRFTAATLAGVALAVAALAVPGAADARIAPIASIKSCKSGDSADARAAVFYGRMKQVNGTDQMMMRFTLMQRFGDSKQIKVDLPALRAWRQSTPGVKVFGYSQTVAGLAQGGDYRAKIEYRWLDRDGNLLRKDARQTGVCHVKGDLANLALGDISAGPGPVADTSIYKLTVMNVGKVAANDVAVELFVDGAATDIQHIVSLAPNESRQVSFRGPVCKRRLRALVDPNNAIHEESELDNEQIFGCP
jgi:hypothetical protein